MPTGREGRRRGWQRKAKTGMSTTRTTRTWANRLDKRMLDTQTCEMPHLGIVWHTITAWQLSAWIAEGPRAKGQQCRNQTIVTLQMVANYTRCRKTAYLDFYSISTLGDIPSGASRPNASLSSSFHRPDPSELFLCNPKDSVPGAVGGLWGGWVMAWIENV